VRRLDSCEGHIEGRKDIRAGSYERSPATKAGPGKLKVPKLRRQTFEHAPLERHWSE